MNLGGFRHVAPFTTSSAGLSDISELKTSLPFESRASLTRPDFSKCTKPLDLPKPPKAPTVPQTLSEETWTTYIQGMNAYMFNWNSFSYKILMQFQQRQEERREIGPSWVLQVGGDCQAYLEGLEAEEKARKWWDVACDHHKEAMIGLKNVREKMLKTKDGS